MHRGPTLGRAGVKVGATQPVNAGPKPQPVVLPKDKLKETGSQAFSDSVQFQKGGHQKIVRAVVTGRS